MRRRFCLVLIKPSHYDDDGYVIQWVRSSMPSNSLAALYGLALDCGERQVLGADVEIDIHAFDETNTRIRPERISRLIERAGLGMVMLVGVQSNQYPRALDIARSLRNRNIPVAIGGFHVSGTISMVGEVDVELDRAQKMGVSLFAGEAEGRLELVLRDCMNGELRPLYNFMAELPSITGAPVPFLPAQRTALTSGNVTSFDAGRGCPYQCSFCTIINVQGRKSRRRSPDDIEKIVRTNYSHGLRRFFITDDNFARNKDWEAILDRLIYLRNEAKLAFSLTIQVDTLSYRLPNFIEKCKRANVRHVFIGLENINPANLAAAKKNQNKITEYRQMLLAWKYAGIITYVGYILGFPNDTVDSILRDIELIKRELPIDLVEFYCLTPLPGSEDHLRLLRAGAPLEPDLNKYDNYHVTTTHARMSTEEWARVYEMAWERYYNMQQVETILRRAARCGGRASNAVFLLTWFKASIEIEKIHPLEGGFIRRKNRRDRRPVLPLEPIWQFYPRYATELIIKQYRWCLLYLRLRRIYLKIKRDPDRYRYTDLAITPISDDEVSTRELFRTDAAQAFVERQRHLQEVRNGSSDPVRAPAQS
jgi:radical SAM superfamily enzyme YgiQ (UPF0313 family)